MFRKLLKVSMILGGIIEDWFRHFLVDVRCRDH